VYSVQCAKVNACVPDENATQTDRLQSVRLLCSVQYVDLVADSCSHLCCSIQSEDEVSDDGDYDADAAETAAEGPVVRPVDEEMEGVRGLRRESSRRAAADEEGEEEQSGSEAEREQGEDMETQQQVRFVTVVLCAHWCYPVTFV
jgi:hypothetical protein